MVTTDDVGDAALLHAHEDPLITLIATPAGVSVAIFIPEQFKTAHGKAVCITMADLEAKGTTVSGTLVRVQLTGSTFSWKVGASPGQRIDCQGEHCAVIDPGVTKDVLVPEVDGALPSLKITYSVECNDLDDAL